MAEPRVHAVQRRVLVDEAWMREWIAWGFKEFATYLERQAAFAVFLEQKEKT